MVSNPRFQMAIPTLFLAALACSGDPTGSGNPDGVAAVVTSPSIALGAEIPVVLQNRSTRVLTVGPLGCSAALERHDPATGEWQRLVSLRSCINHQTRVGQGSNFGFNVPSPDATGRYRVFFSASPDGGAVVDVRSNTFEVT